MFVYLFHDQCTCWYSAVTVSVSKQDSFEHSNRCSTSSCCNYEAYMCCHMSTCTSGSITREWFEILLFSFPYFIQKLVRRLTTLVYSVHVNNPRLLISWSTTLKSLVRDLSQEKFDFNFKWQFILLILGEDDTSMYILHYRLDRHFIAAHKTALYRWRGISRHPQF